ncbi:hypothetical protein Emag_007684 [Eimeria magna]
MEQSRSGAADEGQKGRGQTPGASLRSPESVRRPEAGMGTFSRRPASEQTSPKRKREEGSRVIQGHFHPADVRTVAEAKRVLENSQTQAELAHKELVYLHRRLKAYRGVRADIWRIGSRRTRLPKSRLWAAPLLELVEAFRGTAERFPTPQRLFELWPAQFERVDQSWDQICAQEFPEVVDSIVITGGGRPGKASSRPIPESSWPGRRRTPCRRRCSRHTGSGRRKSRGGKQGICSRSEDAGPRRNEDAGECPPEEEGGGIHPSSPHRPETSPVLPPDLEAFLGAWEAQKLLAERRLEDVRKVQDVAAHMRAHAEGDLQRVSYLVGQGHVFLSAREDLRRRAEREGVLIQERDLALRAAETARAELRRLTEAKLVAPAAEGTDRSQQHGAGPKGLSVAPKAGRTKLAFVGEEEAQPRREGTGRLSFPVGDAEKAPRSSLEARATSVPGSAGVEQGDGLALAPGLDEVAAVVSHEESAGEATIFSPLHRAADVPLASLRARTPTLFSEDDEEDPAPPERREREVGATVGTLGGPPRDDVDRGLGPRRELEDLGSDAPSSVS